MQKRIQIAGAATSCLLFVLALRYLQLRPPAPLPPVSTRLPTPSLRRSPSEQARRQALRWRSQAIRAMNEERQRLEAWDPASTEAVQRDDWRLTLLARDRSSNLCRASLLAHQAAALARTRDDGYRAAELIALIDHEAGHHRAELLQAQELMKMASRN